MAHEAADKKKTISFSRSLNNPASPRHQFIFAQNQSSVWCVCVCALGLQTLQKTVFVWLNE